MSDEQEVMILVEFPERPGLHEASLWNLSQEELEAKSKEALLGLGRWAVGPSKTQDGQWAVESLYDFCCRSCL